MRWCHVYNLMLVTHEVDEDLRLVAFQFVRASIDKHVFPGLWDASVQSCVFISVSVYLCIYSDTCIYGPFTLYALHGQILGLLLGPGLLDSFVSILILNGFLCTPRVVC